MWVIIRKLYYFLAANCVFSFCQFAIMNLVTLEYLKLYTYPLIIIFKSI